MLFGKIFCRLLSHKLKFSLCVSVSAKQHSFYYIILYYITDSEMASFVCQRRQHSLFCFSVREWVQVCTLCTRYSGKQDANKLTNCFFSLFEQLADTVAKPPPDYSKQLYPASTHHHTSIELQFRHTKKPLSECLWLARSCPRPFRSTSRQLLHSDLYVCC